MLTFTLDEEKHVEKRNFSTSKLSVIKNIVKENFTVHCKKRLLIFPSSTGMSLTKLSLAGNN
jgi:hypothetical protein